MNEGNDDDEDKDEFSVVEYFIEVYIKAHHKRLGLNAITEYQRVFATKYQNTYTLRTREMIKIPSAP